MASILKSIFSFAQSNSVQLFATTHSYELQQALLSIVKDHEDDVLLPPRPNDRDLRQRSSESRHSYRSAIELSLEVR